MHEILCVVEQILRLTSTEKKRRDLDYKIEQCHWCGWECLVRLNFVLFVRLFTCAVWKFKSFLGVWYYYPCYYWTKELQKANERDAT